MEKKKKKKKKPKQATNLQNNPYSKVTAELAVG